MTQRKTATRLFLAVLGVLFAAVAAPAADWKQAHKGTLARFPELARRCEAIEKAPPAAKQRPKRVSIDAPGKLDKDDTEYVLSRDIAADGSALVIAASRITLNLQGHTVRYGASGAEECHGIAVEGYGRKDVQIVNGTVQQADNPSNTTVSAPVHIPHEAAGIEIAGLTIRWNTPQTSGINIPWGPGLIHDNILVDEGDGITNRHQQTAAINGLRATNLVVKDNAIVRARQTGVSVGETKTVCSGNAIFIDSRTTNSYGVFYYGDKKPGPKSWECSNNDIKGVGVHPIGIGVVSQATGGRVTGNRVEVECTLFSQEYGKTAIGAAGYRTTWGANNVLVENNTFIVRGAKGSVNGQDAWGRGVWVALNKGDSARFANNTIKALSPDPSVKVAGIAITGYNASSGLVFEKNDVESTWATVMLADDYGDSKNYPAFIGNTFRKAGANPDFKWLRDDEKNEISTGLFVDNTLQGVGQDAYALAWDSAKAKEIYFGRLVAFTVKAASGQPAANATVTVTNAAGEEVASARTGQDGRTVLPLPTRAVGNRDAGGAPLGKRVEREAGPMSVRAGDGTGEAALEIPPGEKGPVTLTLRARAAANDANRPQPAQTLLAGQD